MKTKIFISWSGNKSKDIALLLKKWIPILLSNIDTFVSDADVEKGTRGMERISMELQDTSYGIFCLTADNISSP